MRFRRRLGSNRMSIPFGKRFITTAGLALLLFGVSVFALTVGDGYIYPEDFEDTDNPGSVIVHVPDAVNDVIPVTEGVIEAGTKNMAAYVSGAGSIEDTVGGFDDLEDVDDTDEDQIRMLEMAYESDMANVEPEDYSDQPGYINTSGGVRLRAGSNTDSAILATLSMGTVLTVTGTAGDEDDWFAVTYGGKNGYILGIYVTVGVYEQPSETINQGSPDGDSQPGYINTSGGVRLRAGSNTDSAILATLSMGTVLTVTGTAGDENDWAMVTYGGKNGYILGKYVSTGVYEKPAAPAQAAQEPAPLKVKEPLKLEDGESAPGHVYVSGGVRLRAESNTDSEILATLGKGTALTVTGVENDWAKVTYGNVEGYILADYVSLGEYVNTIELVDWWEEGKSIMKPGTVATVTDVATGISFNIKVMSVRNHADVEPLTADDAAKIKQIRGGEYTFKARASILSVNGRTIAISCNGMPHSISTIKDNNFDGHFCIHFLNSRNHYNNKTDPSQQQQILIAYGS